MLADGLFDAAVHLGYQPPKARHSMKDLGLDPSGALCDFAVTEPFRLLSEAGVSALRKVNHMVQEPRLQALGETTAQRAPSS